MEMLSNINTSIICQYNRKNQHLLKESKILPCGSKICLECLMKNLNKKNGEFKCNFDKCKKYHLISDVNKLKSDSNADMTFSLDKLTKNYHEKLQKAYKLAKYSVSNENLDLIFNSIENDIKKRFQQISNELKLLQNELLQITLDYRQHVKIKAVNELQVNEKNYQNLLTQMQHQQSRKSSSQYLNDDVKLKHNLYLCESYINELDEYSRNIETKLKRISFEANDWLPDSSIFGKFTGLNLDKFLIKLLANKEKTVSLNGQSIHGLTTLPNGNLLATSIDTNELIVLDRNFNVIKKMDNHDLSCPLGLSSNNVDRVYVSDMLNHRILILDNTNFNLIKIIGTYGSAVGQFNRPIDVAYFSGSLYVLDVKNNRVQEFTQDGVFKREIKLDKCKRPTRLDVSEDTIAVVDDFEKVLLYSFTGELKQVINNVRLTCFFDTHLFTCDDNGIVSCYENYYDHSVEESNKFLFLFKRTFTGFMPPISFMKFFNGHLVVSLGGSKKGLAIF